MCRDSDIGKMVPLGPAAEQQIIPIPTGLKGSMELDWEREFGGPGGSCPGF